VCFVYTRRRILFPKRTSRRVTLSFTEEYHETAKIPTWGQRSQIRLAPGNISSFLSGAKVLGLIHKVILF